MSYAEGNAWFVARDDTGKYFPRWYDPCAKDFPDPDKTMDGYMYLDGGKYRPVMGSVGVATGLCEGPFPGYVRLTERNQQTKYAPVAWIPGISDLEDLQDTCCPPPCPYCENLFGGTGAVAPEFIEMGFSGMINCHPGSTPEPLNDRTMMSERLAVNPWPGPGDEPSKFPTDPEQRKCTWYLLISNEYDQATQENWDWLACYMPHYQLNTGFLYLDARQINSPFYPYNWRNVFYGADIWGPPYCRDLRIPPGMPNFYQESNPSCGYPMPQSGRNAYGGEVVADWE